ncbi:Thymidylate kinase [Mycoplasmopsis californica]|uniref:Thymidylate kinase n=1 Tax=Mycoplasmopsis equigenitalium TaxID=114883 RepID=A0ABY5J119_9BACT|nr:dTMP kinase [Mycoplasmopsis equigenitalium]UUD36950.1 dTMP kinase [Mycoplasmopsis equigenitalium]VEU69755.1 Thymidylate kinase [Mycoplasmopsis californica]
MFITFEGLDASGKSTAIKKVYKYLKEKYPKLELVLTREPGGINLVEAERVREIVLDKNSHLSDWSEAFLISAARRIHMEKVIWPALKAKKLILCDRYVDSFYAYQGFGREIGYQKLYEFSKFIIEDTMPNLTFYFEISVDKCLERMHKTRTTLDRLDSLEHHFYERVEEGYKFLINQDKERFLMIDATKSVNKVVEQVIEKLENNKRFQEYINGYF